MARAYSDDLRRKLLEAYHSGKGSLTDLAELFGTSVSWAKNVSSTFLHTGKMEGPVGGKRGRRSRVTSEALEYLASRVKEQPDLTLARLREDLEREYGIQIGHSQLWVILKRMGLRFKKSRSVPPNRTASESRPKGNSGGKKPDRSIRSALSFSTKAVSPQR
jgi:transposase